MRELGPDESPEDDEQILFQIEDRGSEGLFLGVNMEALSPEAQATMRIAMEMTSANPTTCGEFLRLVDVFVVHQTIPPGPMDLSDSLGSSGEWNIGEISPTEPTE